MPVPTTPTTWADRLDATLDRAGLHGVVARDTSLGVGLAVLTVAGVALLLHLVRTDTELGLTRVPVVPVLVLCAAQAAALALRRVHPRTCLALVVLCQVGLMVTVPADGSIRVPACAFAAYAVGLLLPPPGAAAAVASAVLVEGVAAGAVRAVAGLGPWGPALGEALAATLVYGGGALVGAYVGTRRRYVELLRHRTQDLLDAHAARVRSAISAERTRMARELHDIAAHHLSGVVVQAAAVERLVDKDPAAAREGARWIRTQGRATLEDLRLLVGVLREPSRQGQDARAGLDDDANAPVPGLAVLPELVGVAGGLGADVRLDLVGQVRDLPPVADVTLYRIAQESLANARLHAPGARVRVAVAYSDDEVVLTIENDRPAARPVAPVAGRGGTGLVGMRERAQLVRARIATGPTDEGGWLVRAVLPTPDAARGGTR